MRGVIFDFDGTIADTAYIWKRVDRLFFEKRGMDIPADYVEAISTLSFYDGAVFTKAKYALSETVEDIMAEWNLSAQIEYRDNAALKPFVKEYIMQLKQNGIKIGLATSSHPEYYLPVLKREGVLDYFDGFAHGQDNVANKDKPDIYLLCAKRIGVKPQECRIYEDVLRGLLSAKQTGAEVYAVYDNQPAEVWERLKGKADGWIINFSEVMRQ